MSSFLKTGIQRLPLASLELHFGWKTSRAEQNQEMETRRKQQKETEVGSGKKFIFGAAPNFSEHRINLEIPIFYFDQCTTNCLRATETCLSKCVFLLLCSQCIRLQGYHLDQEVKQVGRHSHCGPWGMALAGEGLQ